MAKSQDPALLGDIRSALLLGWVATWLTSTTTRFVVIEWPTHGYVTVDLERRGWRLGIVSTGEMRPGGGLCRRSAGYQFTGARWRQRLAAAAIRDLQEVSP